MLDLVLPANPISQSIICSQLKKISSDLSNFPETPPDLMKISVALNSRKKGLIFPRGANLTNNAEGADSVWMLVLKS